MDPIIVCENLVKIYKIAELEVVALQGLDLVVERGEMLGIVGASGSGKSTLMNILGGLDRPSAGRVMVDAQDLLKLSNAALNRYRRTKVGFVWQQTARNLISYLTAQENVELPMTVSGVGRRQKREWSAALLHAVELYDRRHHRLTQLSGGEQQRVAIAVALANKPVLLLGDEPTGEVDSVTAQTIVGAFRRLSDTFDLTTIIVTHDARIAEQVDRVVAIRDGKTSTETVRQVNQVAPAPSGTGAGYVDAGNNDAQAVTFHEYVVLDSAGRLQVPQDYLEEFGIGDRAQLEVVQGGILIRPIAGRSADRAGRGPTMEDQVARLFADERPPARRGLFSRLRRRREK